MIDLRSDTVTKPTKAMRQAMSEAPVGDDVYGDDPTLNELEKIAASMVGKEAALFVPSGTMGNQIALMTHTRKGDEVILGAHSHIKTYEVGAAAVLSSVNFHTIEETRGAMPSESIEEAIRDKDIHFPDTALICLENAHGTGVVLPVDYMKNVRKIARNNNIPMHLDGARLFNAASALDVPVTSITSQVDSVMFCLSKGLASPVGSILAGDKAFIDRARKYRKMLGGGMRQAGVLAAAGLISLKEMTKRLHSDHANATYLANQLNTLEGFEVNMDARDINMVFVKSSYNLNLLKKPLESKGILLGGYKGEYMRMVTHNDIAKEDIDTLIEAMKSELGIT
ncbi:MAG: low-specificity L-threonine aldolase [Bacillota bacterium]